MITKAVKKDSFDWVEDTKRFIIGRRLLRKLEQEGVGFRLLAGEEDFEFWSWRTAPDGTQLPIPQETLAKISKSRELLLEELRRWERSREKVARIWLQHDPEYRAQYG